MYIWDDALLAAAAESAKTMAAQAAAEAAAQGAATAGTAAAGELAAQSAPTLAEGAGRAGHLSADLAPLDTAPYMPPSGGSSAPPVESDLGPQTAMRQLSEGNLEGHLMQPLIEYSESVPSFTDSIDNIYTGDIEAELANLGKQPDMPGMPGGDMGMNPLGMFGGGGSDAPTPAPAPAPRPQVQQQPYVPTTERMSGRSMLPDTRLTESTVTGQPTEMPVNWTERMKGAHEALKLASKLTSNKQARQTLDLMQLGTGMASSGGDMSKGSELVMEPLNDLAMMTMAEEEKRPRLSQSMSPLVNRAPMAAPQMPRTRMGSLPRTRYY